MALIGDKIKLTNYTYVLNSEGTAIVERQGGTRSEIEKVADAFDIDWRPYTIDYSASPNAPKTSYALTYTYQLLGIISTAYSYALYSGTSASHYTPDFTKKDLDPFYGNFMTGITTDANGHVVNIYNGTFGVNAGRNENGPLDPTRISYITSVDFNGDGNLSYTYSFMDFGSTGVERKDPRIITNIHQDDATGRITYAYYDATVDSGTLQSNEVTTLSFGVTNIVPVLTGITQDASGQISYSYLNIQNREHSGHVSGEFITEVYLDSEGNLHGSTGTFGAVDGVLDNAGSPHSYITGVTIGSNGKVAYTYANINFTSTANDNGSITVGQGTVRLLDGLTIDSYGNISYSFATVGMTDTVTYLSYIKATYINNAISTSQGILTSVYLDEHDNGALAFTYTYLASDQNTGKRTTASTITDTDKVEVVTGISQARNGLISYTYMSLNTTHTTSGTQVQPGSRYAVNGVYLSKDGELSYTYTDLTVTSGTISELPIEIPTTAARPLYVLTNISQGSDGKISYNYEQIKTSPTTDYIYHDLSLDNVPTSHDTNPSGNIVTVTKYMSMTNGGTSMSHALSYYVVDVPTKQYVDGLIAANDALRYCGTCTPSSTEGGNMTLTHTHEGPAHVDGDSNTAGTQDTTTGACYKIIADGWIGSQKVFAGDMIISNTDAPASETTLTGWDYIASTINLRSNGVQSVNANAAQRVLTNVSIDPSGTLSYTFNSLDVIQNTASKVQMSTVSGTNAENITSSTANGINVLTGIEMHQDGLATVLSYNYSTIYASTAHHGTNAAVGGGQSSVIGSVSLSEDGMLSYSYTDIASDTFHYSPSGGTATGDGAAVVIPGQWLVESQNTAITQIVVDSKGHVTDVVASGIAHGKPIYSETIGTVGSTESLSTAVQQVPGQPTNVITGFLRNDTGHIAYVGISTVSDKHFYNGESNEKLYFTGVRTQNAYSYAYTNASAYMTNGDVYASVLRSGNEIYSDKTAYIGGSIIVSDDADVYGNLHTYGTSVTEGVSYTYAYTHVLADMRVGQSHLDTVRMVAKNIKLDYGADFEIVNFIGIERLWGNAD